MNSEIELAGLEKATVIERDNHSISRKQISPNALKVLYRLSSAGFHAYIVGGGVRDLLLGKNPKILTLRLTLPRKNYGNYLRMRE
jgi:hypothetical protein